MPLDRVHFARALRTNATDAERRLWQALSRYRPRFTRQLPIGPYVADFACRRARLIVEVDGGQHVESAHDARRTAALAADGWQVLRFWNNDVLGNLEGVVAVIVAGVEARLPDGEICAATEARGGRVRRKRQEE